MEKIPIEGLLPQELIRRLIQIEPYRINQILNWVYKKPVAGFDSMTNLPKEARYILKDKFVLLPSKIGRRFISESDGTRKYLIKLEDGNSVECVAIPNAKGQHTACLSTQVGCKFKCSFCASGTRGFKRNLATHEIIDELLLIKKDLGGQSKVANVVIMGMGEPLDNYDNALKAVRIMNDPLCFEIGARKITISTCGVIPGIKKLINENLQFELSISLHAAEDELRSQLMGVNKKYPLEELMAVCREYIEKTGRIITFEYVLIGEVNDSLKDAYGLVNLVKGIKCKVNVIPFNEVPGLKYRAPTSRSLNRFLGVLKMRGVSVTQRISHGADIAGACGQLSYARLF
ncbi:MAG: 23S rRNA (adenine(2503)-C(2))-methyltransferase RlmN [Candidatus Omnitrophica bacterium]|nr:23S rRNA (adenine(2503)-C(2))-methyltransferase RlmN [Candidatus Omnitrophota bacterium]